jgi:hypothetical protein
VLSLAVMPTLAFVKQQVRTEMGSRALVADSKETGSTNLSGVGPVHAADFCGRVTAMWLRIRRW